MRAEDEVTNAGAVVSASAGALPDVRGDAVHTNNGALSLGEYPGRPVDFA